jgi:WD40 repeat protein
VEHYLADEPVEACPPTAGYRLRKFARKYRTALRVASAFLLLLVLGAVASTWQAIRATVAERKARSSERAARLSEQVAQNRKEEADDAKQLAEQRRDELSAVNDSLRRANYVGDMNLARVAWDENNLSRAHELLEKHRPGPGETDRRGFEWHYLRRLTQRELLTVTAHAGGVTAVHFTPDGKRLISAGHPQPPRNAHAPRDITGDVKAWDAATGRPLHLPLGVLSDSVGAVAFSPDGTRLATSRGSQTLMVWDLATGDPVTLEGPADHSAYWVCFSPDGKRLVALYRRDNSGSAIRSPNQMSVWNLASRKPVVTFDRLPLGTLEASFSPDGKQLVAYVRLPGALTVYDAETGREAFSCKDPDDIVIGVAFSPDGKRLAGSGGKRIRIWDVAAHEPVAVWPSEYLFNLTFSPDGRHLVATNIDGVVQVRETETGGEVQILKGHSGRINTVAFCPDGSRLATGGTDGTIRLWDTAGHGDAVSSLRPGFEMVPDLSPDGRCLFVVGFRRELRKMIELWDTATRRMRGGPIELPRPWVGHDWSTAGQRLYLADEGKTVTVVDTESGAVVRGFQVDAEPENYIIAVSPDEKRYAHSGASGTITLRDARTGAPSRTLRGLTDVAQALRFSADGSRLVGVDDMGVFKVWDVVTGREVASTTLSRVYVDSIRFSRDGARVAVVGHLVELMTGVAHVLDAASAREIWSLRGHSRNVTDADFSPDGRRLATASADRTIRIWDLATGQEILKPSGYPNVVSLRFISGGHQLIAGSVDRGIRIWDATPLLE